jgi:hypothetical protein
MMKDNRGKLFLVCIFVLLPGALLHTNLTQDQGSWSVFTVGGTADSLEDVRQLVQAVRVTLEHMGEPMALSQREMEMRKIAKLRESREISPHDMDLNFLWQLNQSDRPLTRQHLAHETGNQAVILTKEDFDALGCIDFIHSSGERMIIDSDCLPEGNIFVLYPEDLGDEEGKPFCK